MERKKTKLPLCTPSKRFYQLREHILDLENQVLRPEIHIRPFHACVLVKVSFITRYDKGHLYNFWSCSPSHLRWN
jgi:hypothetical protein